MSLFLSISALLVRASIATALLAGLTMEVRAQAPGPSAPPSISSDGIVNARSYNALHYPGAPFSIFGQNLAPATQSASGADAPKTLAGVQVLLDGVPCPLYYVSPTQINGRWPEDAASGEARVAVRVGEQETASRIRLRDAAGVELYSEHCALCHGVEGEGGSGPALTHPGWHAQIPDEELARIIREGVPGRAMPAFGGKLDEAQIAALVRYVRELKDEADAVPERLAPDVSVNFERLLNAEDEPENWLQHGRLYNQQRFSPLDQVTRENVERLVPVWSFQTGVPDGLQATPLLVDGVFFLSTSWNNVFAIDARTGAELWRYERRMPSNLVLCCGPVNRGVAVRDQTVYMATLDAHLVALDARSGRVKWDIEIGRPEDNLSATSVPLIVGEKVIVGMAGGDFPSRGFLDAYHAATGERLWRFYTVPAEGEPGSETWAGDSWKTGGGATWGLGSYDPELNLIYWGTGNPYPDYDGDAREGGNLYTDSVIALNPDTGELVWHFQFTPHDQWDWDGINEMVLADLERDGETVKALLHADRNGHFYALDRTDGTLLYVRPFVRVTWVESMGPHGHPVADPAAIPTYEGVDVCPGAAGGKEWNPMAYSPRTGLVYIPVIENCTTFWNYGVKAKEQGLPPGRSGFQYLSGEAHGKVLALDAATGETAWEVKTRTPMSGGMLTTAGGLLFAGDPEGNLRAHDAETGELLWSFQTGSGIRGAPITYELDGVQYVAVTSGMGGSTAMFGPPGAPWMRELREGSALFVFRLFEPGASTDFHGGARDAGAAPAQEQP